jgi:Tol biopolymer transport system component
VELFPSLSPDGKWVVYAADEQGSGQLDILLRAVGGQNVINLTRTRPPTTRTRRSRQMASASRFNPVARAAAVCM